ncbi:MAG: RDD family protein [Chitinophagaceae bacterium]|nr:RDD family protein [Chitinophagaceae bacterium]
MPTILELLSSKYTVFVGSSQENDIVFVDSETSARHCQISKVGDNNFLVVDLGSQNGTYVNNKKIEKEFITEADFISVGSNIFQLTKKVAVAVPATTAEQTIAEKPPASPSEGPHLHSSAVVQTPEPPPVPPRTKISVYFLSAPEDENICRSIDKHLSTIRSNSAIPIEINGDYKIDAGENIAEYKQRLFDADIVLVFVSVDLLNNDGCYERLKKVISNHNNRKTTLLPILARNCMWKATPFANLPLLPKNQQPLNNKQFWNSEDDALTEVVNDIYKAISDFSKPAPAPVQNDSGGNRIVRIPSKPILEIDWRKNYLWKVFWKRVAASLLDGLIIGIPLYILFYIMAGTALQAQGDYYDETGYGMTEEQAWTIVGLYLIMVIAQIFIYAFMESSKWRGTPGKRIMKLQISDQAGNPISFGKALLRNIIKLLIGGFSNIGNGILVFVYAIAQIIAYTQTKKFFHDQLSNTVIGERMDEGVK